MTKEQIEDLFYNGKGISEEVKNQINSRIFFRKGMIEGHLQGMTKQFLEKNVNFESRKNEAVLCGMDRDNLICLVYQDYDKSMSIQASNVAQDILNSDDERKVQQLYFIFKSCKELANMLLKAGLKTKVWSNQMEFIGLPEFNIYLREDGKNRIEFE